MPDNLSPALAVLAAYWAGTDALLTGMRLLNDARDRVLRKDSDGRPVPPDERRHVLRTDWLPVCAALIAVSIVIGLILPMLPRLVDAGDSTRTFQIICLVAAAVPWCGAITITIRGISEYRMLSRSINLEE